MNMTTLDPEIFKIIDQKIEEKIAKAVETVQISLLKENFLTRDEFLKAMEKIDVRFEAMDKRFEAIQKQMDDRFEAVQKQIDKRFEQVYERFNNIDYDQGKAVENISYSFIKRGFLDKGYDLKLKIRQHFIDENHQVHLDTKDVEIDVFHYHPNIICEATFKLKEIEKLRTFLRKIEFIETIYKEPFQRFFFCMKIDDTLKGEAEQIFKKYKIELIVPGSD